MERPECRSEGDRKELVMALGGKYLAASALIIGSLALVTGVMWFMRPVGVQVVTVMRGDAAEIVYATGVIEPRSWAKVAPLMRERIVWLCDCEGEPVATGAELARLDDREARASLEELRARQAFTARELHRLQDLAARNIASRQDLERSESEEARIEAQLAAQQVRVEAFILRAPISGMILRQDGEVGEIAEPGTALFHVGQPRPLRIVAEVNEEDVPRLAKGQRVLVRSDAFPSKSLEARLESITPMGNPEARTYRVRFTLSDDTPLLIGMTVEINIVTLLHEDVLLIPAEALTDGSTVWLFEDGKARLADVQTGIKGNSNTEVITGLADGQKVIVSAPSNLKDGMRVRVGESP